MAEPRAETGQIEHTCVADRFGPICRSCGCSHGYCERGHRTDPCEPMELRHA